jgi:phage baseplate assembly protein gpV/phage protein D
MNLGLDNARLVVTVAGSPLDAALSPCVVSACVRQMLSAPALAEIAFADPPSSGMGALMLGAVLTVATKDQDTLFEGEITMIEHDCDGAHGRVLRVRAYDRLHRLRKRQQPRSIPTADLAGLLKSAADDLGIAFNSAVTDPAARPLAIQHSQSTLDFLRRMALDSGLYFVIDSGTLRLFSLAGEGDPLRVDLGKALIDCRATAGVESLRRSSRALSWDTAHGGLRQGSASTPRAPGPRDAGPTAFEGLGERSLFNRLAADDGEATLLAQADLDRAAARRIAICGTAAGDRRIRPGAILDVRGIGGDVDGPVAVAEATHLFDDSRGYVTSFDSAPPLRENETPGLAATLGRVSDTDDPEELGRVRAKLPMFDDLETMWMPVVLPGAGPSKGAIMLPEVGDDVFVVLPDGDAARGVVIGCLFSERKPPGLERGVDALRDYHVRTAAGQVFTLDGDESRARLETANGDVLEFSPTAVLLRAKHDFVIEAPGRKLTIRAAQIAFEKA